jgi:hypothetical protein
MGAGWFEPNATCSTFFSVADPVAAVTVVEPSALSLKL